MKLVLGLVLALWFALPCSASLIVSATGGSADAQSVTSSSVNTTGANFCAVGVSRNPGVIAGTMSDSKSNAYATAPPTERGGGDSGTFIDVFYTSSSTPTVGASHTFTYTSAVSNFPTITALCFSLVNASPFDQENGGQTPAAASTSLQSGSVTPSTDNQIVLVFINLDNTDTLTASNIDSSFLFGTGTPSDGAFHYGGWAFYQIQTSATARNPTVTWSSSAGASIEIATFKATAAPAGGPNTGSQAQLGDGK